MLAPNWRAEVTRCVATAPRPVHFVGVGNALRGDDGAGPSAVSALRRALGKGVPRWAVIHVGGEPERTLSRIPPQHSIILIDAVASRSAPGTVVCTTLNDTRYGFFATHNIPLRLLPGLAERAERVSVIGIEPGSLEVGEGLTKAVQDSVDVLVRELADQLRTGP